MTNDKIWNRTDAKIFWMQYIAMHHFHLGHCILGLGGQTAHFIEADEAKEEQSGRVDDAGTAAELPEVGGTDMVKLCQVVGEVAIPKYGVPICKALIWNCTVTDPACATIWSMRSATNTLHNRPMSSVYLCLSIQELRKHPTTLQKGTRRQGQRPLRTQKCFAWDVERLSDVTPKFIHVRAHEYRKKLWWLHAFVNTCTYYNYMICSTCLQLQHMRRIENIWVERQIVVWYMGKREKDMFPTLFSMPVTFFEVLTPYSNATSPFITFTLWLSTHLFINLFLPRSAEYVWLLDKN